MHPRTATSRGSTAASPSVTAIVPARYESSRLPGKPLAEIAGMPMIQYVVQRAREAGVDAVIVATDDGRVAEAVRRFGGTAMMTRRDHRSGTDRVAEAAARLDAELIVNVQGDEPLIDPRAIAAAIQPLADDPGLEMSTLCCRFRRTDEFASPHVVKVVRDLRGDALYFSRAPIPYGRSAPDHHVPDATFKHLGLYVYRRRFLLHLAGLPPTPLELAESLEQLRALEHGHRIRVVETTSDSIGVDTAEDLEHVRRLVAGVAPR